MRTPLWARILLTLRCRAPHPPPHWAGLDNQVQGEVTWLFSSPLIAPLCQVHGEESNVFISPSFCHPTSHPSSMRPHAETMRGELLAGRSWEPWPVPGASGMPPAAWCTDVPWVAGRGSGGEQAKQSVSRLLHALTAHPGRPATPPSPAGSIIGGPRLLQVSGS